MRRNVILVTVVAAGLLLMAGNVDAADQYRKNVTVPAAFAATVEATGCGAFPGPQVSVQGSLTPVGVSAEVIFTNPSGAPGHEERSLVSQQVVPENQPVGIPEQSVVGPVGDNPYIWLQLTEENGRPLTSEIFLGRCDQAQFNASASLPVPARASAEVSASACDSASGTVVMLDGQMEILPISAKLIFRNTSAPTGPQKSIVEGAVSLAMLPLGQAYPFPQQEVTGGTSANPLISLQLRQADGEVIEAESHLGRCVALVN